ncbi:MAG: hypothetical protein ACKV2T_36920 [Kofleriaceae bacterium]
MLDHAFRVERRGRVSCADPGIGDERALYHAFQQAKVRNDGDIAIEIDAFPDWIQGPHDDLACLCGAAMELVVQFDSFDDAINLGDAGRAYVFACSRRCGPRSFLMRWDCC